LPGATRRSSTRRQPQRAVRSSFNIAAFITQLADPDPRRPTTGLGHCREAQINQGVLLAAGAGQHDVRIAHRSRRSPKPHPLIEDSKSPGKAVTKELLERSPTHRNLYELGTAAGARIKPADAIERRRARSQRVEAEETLLHLPTARDRSTRAFRGLSAGAIGVGRRTALGVHNVKVKRVYCKPGHSCG
jgi:hypothetical protein